MLSKSAARNFFLVGTFIASGTFILLTIDTIRRVPGQTNKNQLSESAIRGKHLWDSKNCMGCHTLLGEGAYYAPELTKVFERRGPTFIKAMLKDPQAMYPGKRNMQNYHFQEQEMDDLVAFLEWVGKMDLNGFPHKPNLGNVAVPDISKSSVAITGTRPMVFNQMCVVCHSLEGQGGTVGPKLDGVGSRITREQLSLRLHDPLQVKADSKMPKLPLSDGDITELVAFLSQLKETK